ncbi:hypothetical protein ACEUZ9_002219 [Paracoccus litorisediminis]|uniref:hypothetical protein n=1 Tax=Paracoccus litorisediminis TaxID=2006130 RepID=UPI0037341AED
MTAIRLAGADDVLRVVDMIEDLRAAVDGMMPVSRPWTAAVVAGLIQNPEAVVYVSDGGFIAGSMQPTIIHPDRVAMEHGWFARDRSGMRLLRAFEAWAEDQGAVMVKMSTGASGPDLGRLGYTMTEQNWVRRI